jgi:hypothetical protein
VRRCTAKKDYRTLFIKRKANNYICRAFSKRPHKQKSLSCAPIKMHGKEPLPDPHTHPGPLVRRGPFPSAHFPTSYIEPPPPHSNANPPLPHPPTPPAPSPCASPHPSVSRTSPSCIAGTVSPLISLPHRGRTRLQGAHRWKRPPPSLASPPVRGHAKLAPPMAGHGER